MSQSSFKEKWSETEAVIGADLTIATVLLIFIVKERRQVGHDGDGRVYKRQSLIV